MQACGKLASIALPESAPMLACFNCPYIRCWMVYVQAPSKEHFAQTNHRKKQLKRVLWWLVGVKCSLSWEQQRLHIEWHEQLK